MKPSFCGGLLYAASESGHGARSSQDQLTRMLESDKLCAHCRACRMETVSVPAGAGAEQTIVEVNVLSLRTGSRLVTIKDDASGRFVRAAPDVEDLALRLVPNQLRDENEEEPPDPFADFPAAVADPRQISLFD